MSASPIGPRAWDVRVATLVVLALVSLFVAVTAGPSVAAMPAAEATVDASLAEPAPIDDALEDADGTVTVLVRLEAFDEATVSDANEDGIVAARRAHAERTRRPLERYANETAGVAVERGFWITNAALVTVDTERAALADLAAVEGVVAIEADEPVTLSSVGSTNEGTERRARAGVRPPATASGASSAKFTNGLETVRVPEAWNGFHTRGEGVRVAVLDSGVDGDHPDLEVDGWTDFSADLSPEPVDYDGHGTRVSGLVVGGNASGEHVGVAPEATLLHGAVATECDDGERCTTRPSTVLAGIEWALAEDADVISLSLGWHTPSRATIDALEATNEAGVVIVAGVGNGGEGTSLVPGNADDVISVGSVDRTDGVPSFSGGEEIDTDARWGPSAPAHWPDTYVVPDVVAPGSAVRTTEVGGRYTYGRGTSLSTPYVAGTVALMQSATETALEPSEIERALEEAAWKPADAPDGKDARYGSGIVDAAAAIDAVGEHATLEGTVTDAETGAPLSGASIEVVADGRVYERTTDSDGWFELTGLAGDREYAVTVEKAGYEPTTVTRTLPADETTAIDVSLAGAGTIDVAVADAHFGDGVEAATVEAIGTRGTYSATHVGNGTYHLEHVPTGDDYDLRASAPEYVDVERTVSVPDASERIAESVSLSGDAALAVTVETADGEPIENATVSVARGGEGRDGSFDAPATTDEDGRLKVAVPGTGDAYVVTATASESFEPGTVETDPVESGETTPVTVTLRAPLSVPGFGVGAAAAAIAAVVLVLGTTARVARGRSARDAGRRPT